MNSDRRTNNVDSAAELAAAEQRPAKKRRMEVDGVSSTDAESHDSNDDQTVRRTSRRIRNPVVPFSFVTGSSNLDSDTSSDESSSASDSATEYEDADSTSEDDDLDDEETVTEATVESRIVRNNGRQGRGRIRHRTSTATKRSPPPSSVTINRRNPSVVSPQGIESDDEPYEDDLWSDDDESLVSFDSSISDSDSEVSEPWQPPTPLDSDDEDEYDDDHSIVSEDILNEDTDPDQVEMVVNLVRLGCKKKKLRRRIRKDAEKMIAILISGNSYRCPKNKYMRKRMKPQDILSSLHQVYCLLKDADSNEIEKAGYSRNTRDRYSDDHTVLDRTFILVSQRTISRSLDRALIDIVDKLLDDIWNDKSLPVDFRRICYTIHRRGGDALGLKRAFYFQLIEIGSQYRYGLPVIGEVFTTGELEQSHRRLQVQKAFQKWIANENDNLASFVGKPIKIVDTWATGQPEDRLSSQVCANNYVAGGLPWVNVMGAVFENAQNVDQIYATSWTEDEIEQGRNRVYEWINEAIDNGSVLLLAKNQEKLFPNDGLLDKLRDEYDFEVKFTINDGRITSLTHGEAKIILYSPLGYSMDARSRENVDIKIRTFLEMGVLKQIVGFLLGNPILPSGGDDEPDCITAAFFYETMLRNFHAHQFHASAVARDALTPANVRACEQNGLEKVSGAHNGHISTRVRRATWYPETDRPLEMNIVHEAANILHTSSKKTIERTLCKIHAHFTAPGKKGTLPTRPVVGTRWKSLVDNHIVCQRLQRKVKTYVNKMFKRNAGNRSKYKGFVLDDNDDIAEFLWNGALFLVHLVPPEDGEIDPDLDLTAQDWSRYAIFADHFYVHPKFFSYKGVKERIYDRPRKGNTNHQQRRHLPGKRGMVTLNKVYFWPDDPTRAPIVDKARGPRDREDGSVTLCLCYLEDKGGVDDNDDYEAWMAELMGMSDDDSNGDDSNGDESNGEDE